MTALRMRMDHDMLVRGMAERTRETYIGAVARLARVACRSPDQLSPQQVQAYRVHLIRDEKLAWSTCNIAVQAFRFLYHTTLVRPGRVVPMPADGVIAPTALPPTPDRSRPLPVRRSPSSFPGPSDHIYSP